MKIGTFLFALLLASTPLAAQAAAVDSAAAFAARQTAAEVQHGGVTAEQGASGEHEACGAFAPGDIITPHITDSHCIELPKDGWKLWEPVEHELPRWAPIHIGTF